MDLKSCPFCGFVPDEDNPDCIYPIDSSLEVVNLVCYEPEGCGCCVLGRDKEDVIDRWNTRVESCDE